MIIWKPGFTAYVFVKLLRNQSWVNLLFSVLRDSILDSILDFSPDPKSESNSEQTEGIDDICRQHENHSTSLESSLLVKRNLATITKINVAVKTSRQFAYDQFTVLN